MANLGNSVPGNRAAAGTFPQGGGGINTVKGMGIPSEELTSLPPVARIKSGEAMGAAVSQPAVVKPFGFNVQKFKDSALKKDVMKNNLFLVTIYFPRRLGSSKYKFDPATADTELIPMFCSACKLPSVSLITQDIVARYGYDITEKMPVLPDFQDIPFTFISDGRGEIVSFFDRWMNHIVNYDDSRGINTAGKTKNSYQRPYEHSYKDDYSATVEIIVYSPRAERIFVYTLYEVFPKSIYNIDLNWAFTNEVATLDVLMTYRNFKLLGFNQEWSQDSGIDGLSPFQKLVKGATMVQTLASVIKKPQSIGDVLNLASAGGLVARNFNFSR